MFPIFKLFVCFVIQCEPIRKNVLGHPEQKTSYNYTLLIFLKNDKKLMLFLFYFKITIHTIDLFHLPVFLTLHTIDFFHLPVFFNTTHYLFFSSTSFFNTTHY